jgi:hypothetical protein
MMFQSTIDRLHASGLLSARYRCLTPVILATQEAEIRRIAAQSQLRQIVLETLS